MQPQAAWNHTFEPVTSSTPNTFATSNGFANHYRDYYCDDNHLGAQYIQPAYMKSQSEPQQQQQQQQQEQQSYYVTLPPQQTQYQLQPLDSNPANDSNFKFKEIGEVINGKEFDTANNNQNIDCTQAGGPHEETAATIYENLQRTINEPNDESADDTNRPLDHLFRLPDDTMANTTKPYVEIIEQPAKCALRFRYKCEGRSAGSLPGVNSIADSKTFPAIRINNYRGRAVVVISCVTKDAPYRAHPHNIVGKEGCKKGICTIVLNGDQDQEQAEADKVQMNGNSPSVSMTKTFTSLGIQCVKRKDIEDSLTLRESINVDPYRNGFQHKLDTSAIDLNVVRLCFQVFIEGSTPSKCDIPLMPIVSEPVHDKKAMSDLIITKLSHCSAPATGGREVILLCDRIAKDDIQVRFFEENQDGELVWETYSEISPADVHKQVAICFRTPKYYNPNINQPVMARIQLRRISDNQVSEPRMFQFLPCESDEDIISRKRQKIEWVNNHYALDNILH